MITLQYPTPVSFDAYELVKHISDEISISIFNRISESNGVLTFVVDGLTIPQKNGIGTALGSYVPSGTTSPSGAFYNATNMVMWGV